MKRRFLLLFLVLSVCDLYAMDDTKDDIPLLQQPVGRDKYSDVISSMLDSELPQIDVTRENLEKVIEDWYYRANSQDREKVICSFAEYAKNNSRIWNNLRNDILNLNLWSMTWLRSFVDSGVMDSRRSFFEAVDAQYMNALEARVNDLEGRYQTQTQTPNTSVIIEQESPANELDRLRRLCEKQSEENAALRKVIEGLKTNQQQMSEKVERLLAYIGMDKVPESKNPLAMRLATFSAIVMALYDEAKERNQKFEDSVKEQRKKLNLEQ